MPRPICATHLDREAEADCIFCSKPLCASCVHVTARGPICTYCLDRIHPRPHSNPPEASKVGKKTVYWSLGFLLTVALLFALKRILGMP